MICLNDYLYSGDTVFRIISKYAAELSKSAITTNNKIDLYHYNYMLQLQELIEHNNFLTEQSQRVREFYKYMTVHFPELAFTFKGRIKSLIRSEEKFNGYIVEFVHDYYKEHQCFPLETELKERLSRFRDLIAYRFVISVPICNLEKREDQEKVELDYLYKLANVLPEFMEERGFSIEDSGHDPATYSTRIKESLRPYYRDYIQHPGSSGYQSLHITLYDYRSRCHIEIQLRTKAIDDLAEIGVANHWGYEKRQEKERSKNPEIPEGKCHFFDEAYERLTKLQSLDLSKVDVNMFSAINNRLINDGCGLYRGRLITPFEHLSKFQNDL